MTSAIEQLTPYMASYSEEFADSGNINWLPYTMFFHPFNYRSAVVNTDDHGFRYSEANGLTYSVADCEQLDSCRLLAGSSTVFGIGASADGHTLASRMSVKDSRSAPWINFGGRSFNSTQEMILFMLNRHRLPKIEEVVLLSGFNDLGLARLPRRYRSDNGAFFMCHQYYEAIGKAKQSQFTRWFSSKKNDVNNSDVPSLEQQINSAADLVIRNLANWHAVCQTLEVPLTFILQPLANWIRPRGSQEEEALFSEREKLGSFAAQYGDILTESTYHRYRDRLATSCQSLDIDFVDLTPSIQSAISDDFWLFVDRIHFTDQGHDLVAQLILESIAARKELL